MQAEITHLRTYTPKEVAGFLSTSESWIRQLVRDNRISHLRVGKGKIVFRHTHILELMKLCESKPRTAEKEISNLRGEQNSTIASMADAARYSGFSNRTINRFARGDL